MPINADVPAVPRSARFPAEAEASGFSGGSELSAGEADCGWCRLDGVEHLTLTWGSLLPTYQTIANWHMFG